MDNIVVKKVSSFVFGFVLLCGSLIVFKILFSGLLGLRGSGDTTLVFGSAMSIGFVGLILIWAVSLLLYSIRGVGVPLSESVREKIYNEVNSEREGNTKIIVPGQGCGPVMSLMMAIDGDISCCGGKMIAADVYYGGQSPYRASPSFVCANCLRYVGPCDYDPPPF